MNVKTIAFGILLVTSIAAAKKTGRVVRRRPTNRINRGGKSLTSSPSNIRRPNPVEPQFSASEELPPQFNPSQSSIDEAGLSDRQGFAFDNFDNSIPPQFSSFAPLQGGNGPINFNSFENVGAFQNEQDVNGGDPFIGEFEVGPSGEANFDISGPSGPSPGGFTNTGLELTPDNFGNFPNVNQREFPNVNQREFPNVNQPRDSFPEDAPNLPLSATILPINDGFQDNAIRDQSFQSKNSAVKKSGSRKGQGRGRSLSRSSAFKNQGRRAPPVAAERGPQFGGGSNRQNRQFGQDDSIGGGSEDDTAEYNFAYEVNSDEGAQFSQQENAEDGVISGEYRVNLPDGRIQIVRYSASAETGFLADVTYEGEAVYPDQNKRRI